MSNHPIIEVREEANLLVMVKWTINIAKKAMSLLSIIHNLQNLKNGCVEENRDIQKIDVPKCSQACTQTIGRDKNEGPSTSRTLMN